MAVVIHCKTLEGAQKRFDHLPTLSHSLPGLYNMRAHLGDYFRSKAAMLCSDDVIVCSSSSSSSNISSSSSSSSNNSNRIVILIIYSNSKSKRLCSEKS